MSEDLQPLYSIEISVGKSPKKGVKCGAIVIFKLNSVNLDFEKKLTPDRFDPKHLEHATKRAQEIQDEISKQTEVMWRDPTYFKETEGRWIPWAIDEALRLFDSNPIHGNARIALKCPKLRISVSRSPKQIAAMRSNPRQLFPVMNDIDQLLGGDFSFDPWSDKIRRGRINAEQSKR
jgi:hypothetical protein